MENNKKKVSFKSGLIAAAKYVFATAFLGMIVLLVIATYVSAN